jgi:uncharacterized cofD-like protein
MPQVGDTRQCLGALVDEASVWGKLLRHRFTVGDLRGLSVGNLMLAALADLDGSLCSAVEELRRVAGITQRVLPVSDGNTHIAAELEGGQVVVGEWQIIQRQSPGAIVRLFLHPQVAAHPAVLEAIATADLLVSGVRDTIAACRARCVYVCNLMTQPGQTDGYTVRQHLALVQRYLGRQADAVVLNNGPLLPALLEVYAQHGSFPATI